MPGHGEPVTAAFVAEHRDGLARLAELDRAVAAGEIAEGDAPARSPYPEDVTRAALSRVPVASRPAARAAATPPTGTGGWWWTTPRRAAGSPV
ncbi:hypothetical protein [Saccharothrix australiensis]|uniref:hypothetical protein n=1 Tax=Saccharothrix australiensis TaxID=2072 RepID=UPI000EAB7F38|nr:hypothetical protein [Saccharothrix australiensis]